MHDRPGTRDVFAGRLSEIDRQWADRRMLIAAHLLTEAGAALRSGADDFARELRATSPQRGVASPLPGADAPLDALALHPSFGQPMELSLALPVIGERGPDEDELRRETAEALANGALAILHSSKARPEHIDVLTRVALGADRLSKNFRDLLRGKPIPDGPPELPPKLIDLINEIDRRTCALGLSHALHEWGLAASQSKVQGYANGITSLTPNQGCAGTVVTIAGTGFGNAKPSELSVVFPKRGGGCTEATVSSWSDAAIVVTAPGDVGVGCVGFMPFLTGGGTTIMEAAGTLAGELERCIGAPAWDAAQLIRKTGKPIVICPPCLPSGANHFRGGLPFIRWFIANQFGEAVIEPGDSLTLSWAVENATSVEIVELPAPAGQADELPSVTGPLNPSGGTYVFPSVAGTFTWDRQYELRARNTCTPLNAPVTERVTVRMRRRPDLTVSGIEVTQATQFFAANVHMPNPSARKADNAVQLIAGKPTIARIFVDSGQATTFENGVVTRVRARLHGRVNGAALPGSPLSPLNAAFLPDATHEVDVGRRVATSANQVGRERIFPARESFVFRLPAAWTAAGALDLEAEVITPSGVTERNTSNNTLKHRAVFNNGGLPLRIALLRVSYNEPPGTGPLVPPPTPGQALAELDFLQRVYPSRRSLLNIVGAPGGANPWFFSGDMNAGGPGCGMGWNLINVELALRAFFSFGFEDRVFVALLRRPTTPLTFGGCGMPMSSLGGTVVGSAVLAAATAGTALLGPIGGIALAIALARLGTAALGVASALIATPPGRGGTLAQEVGHAYARYHIPGAGAGSPFESGWPDYENVNIPTNVPQYQSIGEYGVDIDDSVGFTLRGYAPRTVLSATGSTPAATTTTDFMSYAPGSDWVSPFIYETMQAGVVSPPAGVGPSPAPFRREESSEVEPVEVALVRGVMREGDAEIWPIYTQRKRFRFVAEEKAAHRIELRTEEGKVLASRQVQPATFLHEHGHDHEADFPFPFAVAIPWHPRARILILLRGDRELRRLSVPLRLPALERPRVERSERGYRVEWWSSGEDVRFMVRYANGRAAEPLWRFLAADLTQTTFEIPAGSLAGGRTVVQIGATTNGATSWSESEPFDVPLAAPEAVILGPEERNARSGAELAFHGDTLTLDAESIADEHFRWASDRDGDLGQGRSIVSNRLSLGTHAITLRVTAPDRPETSAIVHVTVAQSIADGANNEPAPEPGPHLHGPDDHH